MAIDTREKRTCVVGVGRPWHRSKFPGSIDEAWRIASGNAYCGNSLIPLPVETTVGPPAAAVAATHLVAEPLRQLGYTPCNTRAHMPDGTPIDIPGDPNLMRIMNIVNNVIQRINQAGQDADHIIPQLFVNAVFDGDGALAAPAVVKAQGNWQLNGGDPKFVAKVSDWDGGVTGTTFDVFFPTAFVGDPNVVTGDLVTVTTIAGRVVAGVDAIDRKIGTIEWAAVAGSRKGWGIADGTNNVSGGSGIDHTGRWLQGVASSPGELAAADTGSKVANISDHTALSVAGALDGHPSHHHATGAGVDYESGNFNSASASEDGMGHLPSAGDTDLNHADPGHTHTPGNPITVKDIPYERLDNSV